MNGAGVLFALILTVPPSTGAAAVATAPLAGAERVVFDNGLVLLLLPEPGTGLVSVGMMYRVGAKNEAAGTTGLAHYAEHMNFRATTRFPGREITEGVTRRGGRWTGYTWIDQTFYQTTLQKDDLLLALDLEADRMGGALYDPAEFERERESVVAELRSYDDPKSLLYDEVLAAHFQIHPYRNNTIGWLTDVDSVSRDAAYSFYRRLYHPANAVLAVGGDFERDAVVAAVRERFDARPAGEASAHVATVEAPPSGERRVTVRKPGPHAEVLVAFRAPALADPDFPAFVLFDALLAGGKGLRLLADYDTRADTPLRREVVAFGHAREVESAFQASLYPYVYTLRATTPEAAQLPAAEAALLRSLEAAVERAWTDHELERARAEVAAGLARDLDTLAGRAHQLAFFEVAGGLQHLLGFEERLLAVDREAVRRVARRFKRETATLGWFVPTPGASVFTGGQARPPASTALSPGKAAAVDVASRAAPEVQTFPLTSGLTLRVTEAPRTPLVALRGRVEAGGLFTSSPSLSALLTSLFARAVQAGPGPPLAFDFDEAPAGSGHDVFLGFGATGLPEDLPALAESVARGFSGERADFEASRQHALARAQSAEGDTPSILVARTRALLFPTGSALSLPPWGDARTLGETTAPSVCDAFRRFVTPARTTVSVAGPVDPAQVRRAFEDAFRRVAPSPGGTGLERSEAAAPRGPAHTARIHLKRPDASQNDIHVAWPGDRSRPHDDAATSLLLYLLGETFYSGRLGRALVEPGLVYSVWTELRSAPGLHGFLLVQTAASTATTPEVVRRILEVLEAAARGEFTAAELEEAQAYLRGKAARGRDGARLLAQAALEPDPSGPAAQTVTLAQLNDTARRLFARGAPLVLIGGPE